MVVGRKSNMIEVICANEKFLVKGSFSLGIAGVFENKEFTETGTISIYDTLSCLLEDLHEKESFYYQPLLPYLQGKENGAAIAQGLADYYNQKEREAQAYQKQINDCILFHLFEDMEGCEYPFWEIREAIVPDCLQGIDRDSIYHTGESVSEWWKDFYELPNNGSIPKIDVEGNLRRMFPMFDFDGLYRSIIPQGMLLHGRFIEVQFSDGWGKELFCSAYNRFDENFASWEWNNH